MFVLIFLIIISLIIIVFYLVIQRYYISKKYMLEDLDTKNITKIRGDYITIFYNNEATRIFKKDKDNWFYNLNNKNECELKPNECISVGDKKFRLIVKEKNGGLFILLPLFITLIITFLLFYQGYAIITTNKQNQENGEKQNIITDNKQSEKDDGVNKVEDNKKDEKETTEKKSDSKKDIHTIVLDNENLFQDNIKINWTEFQIDGEKRSLKNNSSEMGISVSEHQKNINWKKVKKYGIDYALIRIGRRGYETGELKMDAKFHKNMNGAIENNIKVGGYFYSQAINQKEMDEEIDLILDAINKYNFDYPIGISLERRNQSRKNRTNSLSDQDYIDLIKYFCIKMKKNNRTPMIMEKEKWFNQFKAGTFDGYLKLVSNEKSAPSINNCIIWEYREKTKKAVAGINSEIELSISAYLNEKDISNK